MTISARLKKHSLKFISLFLSIFLWAYILNSEKLSFEKVVYLDYILPDHLILSQKPPQEVIFTIEGPRAFIKTVLDREDRILIDLNRLNEKKQSSFYVDLNPAQLSLPLGMTVENVSLRRIPIRLEKKFSKKVALKADFSGPAPENFSIQKIQLIPSEIEVEGPRSVLENLNFISTRPIDFDALVGEDYLPVDLMMPDERLSILFNGAVKLKYDLKLSSSEFVVSDLPIKFLSKTKNVSSQVKTASIKLKIPQNLLKNRSNISSSVQVWADIPQHKKGKISISLNVVLPTGVQLLEVTPKTIVVNIQ